MKVNINKKEQEFLITHLKYVGKFLLLHPDDRKIIDSLLYKLGESPFNSEKPDILTEKEEKGK
jgi:hypothetical protein